MRFSIKESHASGIGLFTELVFMWVLKQAGGTRWQLIEGSLRIQTFVFNRQNTFNELHSARFFSIAANTIKSG